MTNYLPSITNVYERFRDNLVYHPNVVAYILPAITVISLIGSSLSLMTGHLFNAIILSAPLLVWTGLALACDLTDLFISKIHEARLNQKKIAFLNEAKQNPALALRTAIETWKYRNMFWLVHSTLIPDDIFTDPTLDPDVDPDILQILYLYLQQSHRIKTLPTPFLLNIFAQDIRFDGGGLIREGSSNEALTIELMTRTDLDLFNKEAIIDRIQPRYRQKILEKINQAISDKAWERRAHLLAIFHKTDRFNYAIKH